MDPDRNIKTESGIGLIEIVVSILLLGLLAVAALPLLVQALKQGPRTASVASSTELVASGLALVRQATTCVEVTALSGTTMKTVGGVDYTVTTTVLGSCPSVFPGNLEVRVESGPASGGSLAEAGLLAWIEAAS